MKLYAAFDLHSSSSYLTIIDEKGSRVFRKKLPNDPKVILEVLGFHRNNIVGIAVESTYNWYWMVDTLMEQDYAVHLANPAAIQKYTGLKYADDVCWLAEMLRLGILPEGYIYPQRRTAHKRSLTKEGASGKIENVAHPKLAGHYQP